LEKAILMTGLDEASVGFFGDDVTLAANRTQARHGMLVDGFRHVIADSTVLLLGAGDGRWCHAYAAAGALRVIGVEARRAEVARFGRLPEVGLRSRIEMRCADPQEALRAEAAAGERHDVIALFDMLEGCADLPGLLSMMARLRPRLVIVDGLFAVSEAPVLLMEHARRPVCGAPGLRLLPSRGAVALSARVAGFELDWIDWTMLEAQARLGLSDYFQSGAKCRASFTLVPALSPEGS
jgi:hypothetical protein